jgi:hypothetical protein
MVNKSQIEALSEFQTLYINAVKKNKKDLMRKVIGIKVLDKIIAFATDEKVEMSGGLDFEDNEPCALGLKHLRGTHWSSPFFQEEDHEMQFHTHVAYRRDRNTASCHPSPADMANVSLLYPGIVLWENKEGIVEIKLLLSANMFFASPQAMEKSYNKAQGRTLDNTSNTFVENWRANLNRAGMDFYLIDPLKEKIFMALDDFNEDDHNHAPTGRRAKKGSLEDVASRYRMQKPYYCEKHKRMHRFGTLVYDRCAKRIGVDPRR